MNPHAPKCTLAVGLVGHHFTTAIEWEDQCEGDFEDTTCGQTSLANPSDLSDSSDRASNAPQN